METIPSTQSSDRNLIILIILSIVFGLLFIAAVIFTFISLRPFEVKGEAMSPNHPDGQYFLANQLDKNMQKGKIVIFKAPPEPDKDYVKRVIGLPGDTLLLKDGNVYLNGNLLDESSYLIPGTKTYAGSFLKDGQIITIPKDKYFMMGDNRNNSFDSRDYGFVPKDYIVGSFLLCYVKCPK